MIALSASGQVARGREGPGNLDMELELNVVDEKMHSMIRSLGVRLSDDGTAKARLGGTLASPTLR